MKKLIPILSILLSSNVYAEELVFEMSVFGIRFGTMVVTRTMENDSTELYTLYAQGKTDFFFMQREEQSRYEVRYRHGKLYSSDYMYINKGVKEKWTMIRSDGHQYVIKSDKGPKQFVEAVDYSLLKLYFEPMWKRTKVFCEEECSYSTMLPSLKEQRIEVTCENGTRSTFFLRNGTVDHIDVHLAVATVKLKRIK